MNRPATAIAHPNIALVKYWGKRDERLILPHQSSLSITLAPLSVRTTVELGAANDEVEINGRAATGEARRRVLQVIGKVRAEVRGLGRARVVSHGDFPEGAGLASSAAAFAALAVAARAAAGLRPNPKEASILARLGSGSACRSVQGGFCLWQRGRRPDGKDSYARQVVDERHWPELRMVVAILSRDEKAVSSRDGMRHTVRTSPFYPGWVASAERDARVAERLVKRRDLEALGELAEANAWRMHATAAGARPPLCYLKPETLRLIQAVEAARRVGLPAWFTLDAGPNPVFLTDDAHAGEVEALCREQGALEVVRAGPGADARVV